jgi:hypothetical protein
LPVDADGGIGEPKSERFTGNKPPVAVPNKRHGGVGGCIDSVGTVYKGLWKSLKGFMLATGKQVRDEKDVESTCKSEKNQNLLKIQNGLLWCFSSVYQERIRVDKDASSSKVCSGRRKEEQSSNLDNSSKIRRTTLTLTFKTGDLQTLTSLFRQPDTVSEQVQEDRRACLTHKPIPCYAIEQIPDKHGGEALYASLASAEIWPSQIRDRDSRP